MDREETVVCGSMTKDPIDKLLDDAQSGKSLFKNREVLTCSGITDSDVRNLAKSLPHLEIRRISVKWIRTERSENGKDGWDVSVSRGHQFTAWGCSQVI